ncbi:hypothetical protein ABPG75_011579 [Micractinium tetrahymenae]
MAGLLELQFGEGKDPRVLYNVHQEYAASSSLARTPNSNFLRGAKWSPDGACLLTASDDGCLRIFDTPLEAFQLAGAAAEAWDAAGDGPAAAAEPAGQRTPAQPPAGGRQADGSDGRQQERDTLRPALCIQEGELLYDFCWFPAMSAAEPASCCLATTGRAQPVHLWDALTGELRCSYRAYDDMDEVAPAHSLAFSLGGDRLFCGFNRAIREFRVERPGRDCSMLMAHKRGGEGLPGIVSCMTCNPDRSGMLAAGSYAGAAALLDSRTRELLCLLEGGHSGGVTHMCFSACGNYLYTGARKDAAILCWDVRYSSGVLYTLQRDSSSTNQRMYFDVEPCGRHLAAGGEDGAVRVYDLRDGSLAAQFQAAADTVNGVAFHPFLPLLATASGQRRYPLAPRDEEGGSSSSSSSDDSRSACGGEESDSGSDGGLAGSDSERMAEAAAAPRAFPGLSADENVLRVWRCAARLLPPLAEGGGGQEAAAEAGPEAGDSGNVAGGLQVEAAAAAGAEPMAAD